MTVDIVADAIDYLHAEIAVNQKLERARAEALSVGRDWFDHKALGYHPSAELAEAVNRFPGFSAMYDHDCCVIVEWGS